ncbi:D-alanyl-D-alanine carboxypeptidase family protein [Roseomonas xinghualingensis]|uniref:D-alanyl-D-alanine carboxypeptidase family protein n=1 Tax=Roseomonas xinghualingensis TaxID=2986475 RepID=UPI0021F20B32|nr:D-alanyl-D-alanine carboxypeptidase family protein [Roseomonas sp. SXEYE001]MCV4206259.1 D-alanyl-D-alanine carboxypeptidase [Roseomonas sp. SXEYE001]
MLDASTAAAARVRRIMLYATGLAAFLMIPVLGAKTANAQIGSGRYSAFVQEAESGEVLLAINADEPRYPASLTKMMTLYLAFEALERGRITENTPIRVSRHAAGMEPSKLGLRAGSTIRVRNAIMALITKSANDAAAALGEHLAGGSEAAFGRMMTRKARAIGMSDTTFRNASGLPHPAQVTTARDMAVLSRRLIRDFPERYAYFSAASFDWRGRHMPNHNRLLANYDGADGIKTGYIRASGFNLAASAMRDGRRLVAVVFGGSTGRERDAHVMALLDRGFAQMEGRPSTEMMMARRGTGLRLVGSAMAAPIAPIVRNPSTRRTAMATPAPRRAARASRPAAGGSWLVQVGAFAERADAQAAARRAAARGGKVQVERVGSGRKQLWRARVTGLSANAARSTCRRTRGPCMVIAPRGR